MSRGKAKPADYALYYKPDIPIAIIEPRTTTTASAMACSKLSTMPPKKFRVLRQKPILSETTPSHPDGEPPSCFPEIDHPSEHSNKETLKY